MADPDAIKKITDFLEQLDKEGLSAGDFLKTLKSTTKPSVAASTEVKLGNFTGSSSSKYKFHNTLIPRVGNVDLNGVWTGLGKGGRGKFCKDYFCYRDLDLQNKTLSELSKITQACKKGLQDKPEFHFSLATEKVETKLNDTLREMETFIVDHGLEGCFNIITEDSTLNAFRNFGRISDEMAQTWIDDVLKNGVRVTAGSSDRYELCPYDADNMEISGETILNSCSTALKRTIKRELPVEERNGVAVFFAAIRNGRTYKNANVRSMCNELEAMDLRKYPGENVLAFCQEAMDKVDEIRLAAQSQSELDNLTQITIQGLSVGSDEGLRSEVRALIKASSRPDCKLSPEQATKELSEYYIDANLRKAYGPTNTKPPQAFQAYVQQQISQASDRLTQDRSSGGRGGRGNGGGRGPGGRSGGRGPGNKHISVSSGDTGDAVTNKKVNDLVRASITADGLPSDSDDHHIKDNDTIVAKYCGKCHRWTKGNKLHYTSECHRTEPYQPPPDPSTPTSNEGNLANSTDSAGSGPPSVATNTDTDSTLSSPSGMLSLRGANHALSASSSHRSANLGWHLKGSGGRGY